MLRLLIRVLRRLAPGRVWSSCGEVVELVHLPARLALARNAGFINPGSGVAPERWVVHVRDEQGRLRIAAIDFARWHDLHVGQMVTQADPLYPLDRVTA